MKKFFAIAICIIGLGSVYTYSNALTSADIELLIALGILDADQAALAREAIGVTSSTGQAGSVIKNNVSESINCIALNDNLFIGMSGTAVSALQQFLQNEGHYAYPTITGYYGTVTKEAVVKFQLAQNLITSAEQPGAGSVGSLTREAVKTISCERANNVITEAQYPEQATLVIEPEPEPFALSQAGGAVAIAPRNSDTEVQLVSLMTNYKKYEGKQQYRFDIETEPNDDIDYYILTLVCDIEEVLVDRREFNNMCGTSARFRASSKGTLSLKIEFENIGNKIQTIGVGVEAYDRSDQILGFTEFLDQLEEAKPRPVSTTNYQNSYVVDESGSVTTTYRPPQRACSRNEQLQYLRYTMTVTIPEDEGLPPIPHCLPGDVQCTFGYPSAYCEIVDGPNSQELCGGSEFFFDGDCVSKSFIVARLGYDPLTR